MTRIALLLAALAVTTPAHADTPPPTVTERYTRSLVIPDAFVVGGFALVWLADQAGNLGEYAQSSGMRFGYAAVAMAYVGLPFAAHLRHGNPRGAARSALTRVGLPVLGGLAAHLAEEGFRSPRDDGDLRSVVVVGGAAVAMLVDWAAFAKVERAQTEAFVVPTGDGGVMAGLGGTF